MQKPYMHIQTNTQNLVTKNKVRTCPRKSIGSITEKKGTMPRFGSPYDHEYRVVSRLKRFGISIETIWNLYVLEDSAHFNKLDFMAVTKKLDKDPVLIMLTSLYVYLLDQLSCGGYSSKEATQECNNIIERIYSTFGVENICNTDDIAMEKTSEQLVQSFANTLVKLVKLSNTALEEK